MQGFLKVLNRTQEIIIISLVGLTIIVGTMQVISRFVFSSPLSWSEEFIRYSFIWITFLGASLAVKNNAHASITVFVQLLPGIFHKILNALANLLCLLFSIMVVKEGIAIMMIQLQTNQLTAAMQIPIAYIFLSIPLSAGIMVIYFLIQFFAVFSSEKGNKGEGM